MTDEKTRPEQKKGLMKKLFGGSSSCCGPSSSCCGGLKIVPKSKEPKKDTENTSE